MSRHASISPNSCLPIGIGLELMKKLIRATLRGKVTLGLVYKSVGYQVSCEAMEDHVGMAPASFLVKETNSVDRAKA